MIGTLKSICLLNKNLPLTMRESWIGAGVIVGGSLVLSAMGILFNWAGFETLGEALKSTAFPAALTLSMPFTWTRGQPWKAQVVIVGGMLAILTFATWLATRI